MLVVLVFTIRTRNSRTAQVGEINATHTRAVAVIKWVAVVAGIAVGTDGAYYEFVRYIGLQTADGVRFAGGE